MSRSSKAMVYPGAHAFGRKRQPWRFTANQPGVPAARSLCGFERLEDRCLLSIVSGLGPDSSYLPPRHDLSVPGGYLTAPATGAPLAVAMDYLTTHAAQLGVAAADVRSSTLTDEYFSPDMGMTHVYLRQECGGIEIVNANLNVNVAADNRVLNVSSAFLAGVDRVAADSAIQPRLTAADALVSAARALKLPMAPSIIETASPSSTAVLGAAILGDGATLATTLSNTALSLDPIPAKLVYVATSEGLRLGWNMVLRTPDGGHWYNIDVDCASGQVLGADDWMDNASYNVFARPTESPSDGSRSLVTDPQDTAASPYGWHDANGVAGAEYTDTRGNNVFAQEDQDANNTGGFRPDGTAALAFDFPLDLTQSPTVYQSAAVTNLFYWNNLCHDIHAKYGFTEAAGNFQVKNYAGQGVAGDPVYADAQDGGYMDNADFGTPPDGQSPRMQMYLWDLTNPYRDGDLDNQIIVHEYGHGVSTRLVGGPANVDALNAQQSGGMGEGWGDWWALMFTQKSTDAKTAAYPMGTYVFGQAPTGGGMRTYPYSYDMTVDPHTYADYNTNNEVHAAGEIWCSVLWDLNWLLIDKYGFNSNIAAGYTGSGSAGNILALQLVTDSLKLMPVYPTFLNARDAILQADQVLTHGANQNEIWQAFARRGMGYSAYDGGSADATTVRAAFDVLPFRISTQTPSGTVAAAPASLDFVFTKNVDPASFSLADDIRSFTGPGGVDLKGQITAASFTAANTLHVSFNQPSAQGLYSMVIGPQILAADGSGAMDQNADGTPGDLVKDRYSGSFRYDLVTMAVSSTVPAGGATLTINVPTIPLRLTFNEAYAQSSIGNDDLVLSQGTVADHQFIDATTVEYQLAGIASETSLLVTLPAGAVSDTYGNPSAAAFSATYQVEVATAAFPATVVELPAGSLVYDNSINAAIGAGTDTDSFLISLDAGQTLTVVATPGATLQPSVTVLGPDGGSLGTAAGAAAGKQAVLQTLPVAAAGTYTVIVASVAGTAGSYGLRLTLNAAVETESHDGSGNNTAPGQNIDSSLIQLTSHARRAAVLGTTDVSAGSLPGEIEPNNSIASANDARSNLAPYTGNLYHLGINGVISSTSDADYFKIGSLEVGDVLGITQSGRASSRGTLNYTYVLLYRDNGGNPVSITWDIGGGPGWDSLIYRYSVATPDTYYVVAYSYYDAGSYALGLWLENAGTAPATGGAVTTETEPNTSFTTANDASSSWRAVQYQSHTTAALPAGDVDYYKFQFTAGDLVSFNVHATTATIWSPKATLYNSAGTPIALEDGTSNEPDPDSFVYSVVVPATGLYYLSVQSNFGNGTYNADLYLSTATAPPQPIIVPDYYNVTLAAGDTVSVGLKGSGAAAAHVALQDSASGNWITGSGGASNWDETIGNYIAPTAGVYTVRVTGAAPTTYAVEVIRNADLEVEPNNSIAASEVIHVVPALGEAAVLGYVERAATGVEPDDYPAGTTLNNIAPGIALSVQGGANAVTCQASFYSSTGTQVFANGTYLWWSNAALLRADFAAPVSSVSIDLVPDDSSDPGLLRAYDAAGVLLQEVKIAAPPFPGFVTMTITRPGSDIAYILAGGDAGQAVLLDHLVVNGGAGPSDCYSLQVDAARTLSLVTTTPGDQPGEFVNLLDPKIDLYDANGVLLASNDNGAPDHRNALVAYSFAPGTYRVRVSSNAGTSGPYVLQAVPYALAGDSNLDGMVDVADLNKVLTNYNKSSMGWSDGDFDGDGIVTVTDLNKVLTNYNNTFGASAAAPKSSPTASADSTPPSKPSSIGPSMNVAFRSAKVAAFAECTATDPDSADSTPSSKPSSIGPSMNVAFRSAKVAAFAEHEATGPDSADSTPPSKPSSIGPSMNVAFRSAKVAAFAEHEATGPDSADSTPPSKPSSIGPSMNVAFRSAKVAAFAEHEATGPDVVLPPILSTPAAHDRVLQSNAADAWFGRSAWFDALATLGNEQKPKRHDLFARGVD